MAGGICLLAFAGLMPMTRLDSETASAVVGIGCMLAIAAALYVKYRGRLMLNMEVSLILGMTLQYLFAPVITRLLLSTVAVGGESGDRYAVKEVYGQAMLVVLLFISAYFFASSLFAVRRPTRRPDGRLELAYSQRTLLVMTGLTVLLWMTRAALLASGSFYTINRSRFMQEDSRYSAWTQFDGGIGPMVIAFLWGALFLKKVPVWLVIGYSLLDIGWNFMSGGRERTLIPFIVIMLTYVIYRNRIPWRIMAILVLPAILLMGFMDYYRYALQNTTENNTIQVSGIVDALTKASNQTEGSGLVNTFYRGLFRINDLEPIAAIYLWTGKLQPFLEGETYGRIPSGLIPRFLWPDKPMVITPINEWYFTHEGGSSPITTPGEGYLNFGWPGVVLAGAVTAMLVRITEWFLLKYLWNVAILPVYIGTLAIMARQHTQAIAVWVPTIIKMFMLTWMIHFLTRPTRLTAEEQLHEDADGTRLPAYY
jgi:hypothetical protein